MAQYDKGAKYDGTAHYDESDPPVPPPMPDMSEIPESSVSYSVETVTGFMSSTKGMLTQNKAAMILKDEDPTSRIASLTSIADQIEVENAKQEKMKTDLRAQTALVDSLKGKGYNVASGGCDKVIVAFGRGSQQAKEATNLRKSLRTDSGDGSVTPPAPASK